MANQIKNLQEQVNPQHHLSHPISQSKNTGMSRSSRRNKRRWEMSKTHQTRSREHSHEESKTSSRDARTLLEKKRQRMSNSVQSLIDRKQEERRKTSFIGSSPYQSPMVKQHEESHQVPPETPILIISPLSAEVLATSNPTKEVPNMAAFDGTTCPKENIMAYKLLAYSVNLVCNQCIFLPDNSKLKT